VSDGVFLHDLPCLDLNGLALARADPAGVSCCLADLPTLPHDANRKPKEAPSTSTPTLPDLPQDNPADLLPVADRANRRRSAKGKTSRPKTFPSRSSLTLAKSGSKVSNGQAKSIYKVPESTQIRPLLDREENA
jgi:hypothetical protein